MANGNKYSKNRNLWRRIYGSQRRKPVKKQYIDPNNNLSFTYDLNKIFRHRDFFLIKTVVSSTVEKIIPIVLAEYDEGTVVFANTTSETTSFNFCFSDKPDAVVLTVDPVSNNSDNIVPYGLSFNSCSLNIGTSAPFSGTIRYRAIYSSTGYPAFVTSSTTPTSGQFKVDAGHITASNVVTYSISYNIDSLNPPSNLYLTTWDEFNNSDIDVSIAKAVTSSSGSSGDISAPLNNVIYFIAVK